MIFLMSNDRYGYQDSERALRILSCRRYAAHCAPYLKCMSSPELLLEPTLFTRDGTCAKRV